jgi:quercetin dioxygenase-like cupin family protein
MAVKLQTGSPYVLAPGGGEAMSWFGDTVTLKSSTPAIGVFEAAIRPGSEPPLHVHRREDEWLYVVDGEATVHAGGENHRAAAGALVFLPRDVPHTFTVESSIARLLFANAPGGFERMFELAPTTPEEAVAALSQFGVEVVGSHPREATVAAP